MRPIRHCLPALAVFALLAGATGAAAEAPRGPWVFYSQLTPKDLRLVRNATAKLLQTGRPGSTTSWKNDISGNFGTMELEASFRNLDLPCKQIDHVLQFKNEADPRLLRLTYCRKGGEWKLAG